ncbi:hypothetical protein AYR66_06345 [Noviherbaspirillum denitrificans]|uniref:Uncharacterized protein n=1 Tax=Noviherbaspirillum denitrificans TaxID=1968433 RepID=A0A254T967_9BURK|nr:hypothetical protein AYR66_06345 [Noviherbaspirillum denitrificans]
MPFPRVGAVDVGLYVLIPGVVNPFGDGTQIVGAIGIAKTLSAAQDGQVIKKRCIIGMRRRVAIARLRAASAILILVNHDSFRAGVGDDSY